MKTKLLLTILLISCLATSTLASIPYEYFSGRSEEADGEIPAAKIPNCVHQRGYKCYACGPDTTGETPVVLIPNSNQQCVPAGQSGCNRFADPQGQFCDLAYGCACQFAIDSTKRTCVSTVKVPNCFIFDTDDETCQTCVGYGRQYQYYKPFATTLTPLNPDDTTQQLIPSGGGINDYGLSADAQTCVDNIANGSPHCLQYAAPASDTAANSCSKCDTGYFLVQTGTPGSSKLRKCQKITQITNCYVHTLDGARCISCKANWILDQSGTCLNPTVDHSAIFGSDIRHDYLKSPLSYSFDDDNCLRWFKNDDGTDNKLQCAQCINYSFLLEFGKCSQQVTSFNEATINYLTGKQDLDKLNNFCRLGYDATFKDQHKSDADYQSTNDFYFCLLKKTLTPIDYYNPVVAPTTPAPVLYERSDRGCSDFNVLTGMCNACQSGFYLNTQTGECISQSHPTCPLTGCLTSEGLSYCTQCDLDYTQVDGKCVKKTFSSDATTLKYCITFRPDGQCQDCEATYMLDNTDMNNPQCTRKGASGCATFSKGLCTQCTDLGKVPNQDGSACVWDLTWGEHATQGGVPGCLTHSEDGVCTAAYDNIFLIKDLNGIISQTKYIGQDGDLCANFSDNGDCTLCNHIRSALVKNLNTGLYQCSSNLGNNLCDKSENDGCTACASCKAPWVLSNGNCPRVLKSGSTTDYVEPESIIRGCVKYSSATACEQCRTPDFIKTTDNQCYDLNFFRQITGADGLWKSLFQQNSGTQASPTLNPYLPTYYEACETASDIYTCTKSFDADKDNIFLTTVDGTTYFGKSAIVYSHNNKDTAFDNKVAGVVVNDNLTADITAQLLSRVTGCNKYTSLLLGTCDTCTSDRTKQTDNTKCWKTDGSDNLLLADQNCQTIDTASGQCNACDEIKYYYDSTNFKCIERASTNVQYCVGADWDKTTLQCNNKCIAGYQYTTLTTVGDECYNIRLASNYDKGFSLGSNIGCNTNICSIKTASFTAGVATVSDDVLSIASCSRGFNALANNQCILKQSDWSTTVAEFFTTSGKVQTCQPGYAYISGQVCSKVVANCRDATPVAGTCNVCQMQADNQERINYIRVNDGKLCIPENTQLPNCETYTDQGDGCRICKTNFKGLEDKGCNPPPNCTAVDRITLRCSTCKTDFILDVTGNCVLKVPLSYTATNCATAYNSTHCAVCSGANVLAIDDLSNDNLYGVGQCISKDFPNDVCSVDTNCELVLRTVDQENCANTVLECIRCAKGTALFGGKCYTVDDQLEYVPYGCINIEFDEDQQAFVCTECDFGYALTADRKYCVTNTGQCSYLDSTECAFYEKAVGQEEVQIQCADTRSNAVLLSAVLMIILNIVFFSI